METRPNLAALFFLLSSSSVSTSSTGVPRFFPGAEATGVGFMPNRWARALSFSGSWSIIISGLCSKWGRTYIQSFRYRTITRLYLFRSHGVWFRGFNEWHAEASGTGFPFGELFIFSGARYAWRFSYGRYGSDGNGRCCLGRLRVGVKTEKRIRKRRQTCF